MARWGGHSPRAQGFSTVVLLVSLLVLVLLALYAIGCTIWGLPLLPAALVPRQPDRVVTRVVTLRQGYQDYEGCEDTFIDGWSKEDSYCGEGHLCLREETERSSKVGLMRFDLASLDGRVPEIQDPEVLRATLRLYAYARTNDSALSVTAHEVLRPWNCSEATWLESRHGEDWYVVGCRGPGDRDSDSLGTAAVLSQLRKWYEWDVTDAVRSWMREPERNFGLVLKGAPSANVQYQLYSANYVGMELQPELVIELCAATPRATAPDLSLCTGYTQQDLEDAVIATGGGCSVGACTIKDNGDGTYVVSCDNQGTVASTTGTITVLQTPTVSAPHIALCSGYTQHDLEKAILDANGGCSIGACTVTDNRDGTYRALCNNQGCTAVASGNITVRQAPLATAPDIALCSGYSQQDLERAVLEANGGCSIGDYTITDNGDRTYTVSCNSQGCAAAATGSIMVKQTPLATAPGIALCSGYSQQDLKEAVLEANGGCSIGTCAIIDNRNDTYTVYCDSQGCIARETGNIELLQTPVAWAPDVNLPSIYYQQDLEKAVLDAGGGCSIGTHTITDNGNETYTVSCNNHSCVDTSTGNVKIAAEGPPPLPTEDHVTGQTPVATAPDIALCTGYGGQDLEIAAMAAGGGCSVGACNLAANDDGTYTVSCNNQGLTDSATGNITLLQTPVAWEPDIALCTGYSQQDLERAVLDASGGCSIGTYTFTDNGDGTYTVFCDNKGCTASASGRTTVKKVPLARAPDVTLPTGYSRQDLQEEVLKANGGCSIGIYTITSNGDGTYTISCNNQGCTVSDRGRITVVDPPSASAPPVTLCSGYSQEDLEEAVRAVEGGCSRGTSVITNNGNGTYTVHCDNQGYTASDTGDITVLQTPRASAPAVTLRSDYTQQNLKAAVEDAGGGCSIGTRTIIDNGDGTYTVSCNNQRCVDAKRGSIDTISSKERWPPSVAQGVAVLGLLVSALGVVAKVLVSSEGRRYFAEKVTQYAVPRWTIVLAVFLIVCGGMALWIYFA